jgi:hypothetical protein
MEAKVNALAAAAAAEDERGAAAATVAALRRELEGERGRGLELEAVAREAGAAEARARALATAAVAEAEATLAASGGRRDAVTSEAVARLTAEVEQHRAMQPRYESVQERVGDLVTRVAEAEAALQASGGQT